MYLPLGARVVTDAEIDDVSQALNRLKHNPDQMLDQVEFDSTEERAAAQESASEKDRLVRAIAADGADKKALGAAIREVNERLATMLAPYQTQLQEELDDLLAMQSAGEILTDRTYPFCFWSPSEVADKAR
jgi:N-formylglutamate amidohydrolase